MAARPSAPARRARLDGALTDWALAERDVRGEERGEKKREVEGREMRYGGWVNDEISVEGGKRVQSLSAEAGR